MKYDQSFVELASREVVLLTDTHVAGISLETESDLALWTAVFKQGIADWRVAFVKWKLAEPGTADANFYTHEPLRWMDSHLHRRGSYSWLCELLRIDPDIFHNCIQRQALEALKKIN